MTKEVIGSGDSYFMKDILPDDDKINYFQKVRDEIKWEEMYHKGGKVPRLINVQGEITENTKDGTIIEPLYRHPIDKHPKFNTWTPTIKLIKDYVEGIVGKKLNHVAAQYYRTGDDFIGEHCDKTIDIAPDTFIVNVSLGATREMILKTKIEEEVKKNYKKLKKAMGKYKLRMTNNSVFVMGLRTNMEYLHSIRQDKRPNNVKTGDELRENGERISLTFRTIGTFKVIKTSDEGEGKIFGQGAKGKTLEGAHDISHDPVEIDKLVYGFSRENREHDFKWADNYGCGFDVVNLT